MFGSAGRHTQLPENTAGSSAREYSRVVCQRIQQGRLPENTAGSSARQLFPFMGDLGCGRSKLQAQVAFLDRWPSVSPTSRVSLVKDPQKWMIAYSVG